MTGELPIVSELRERSRRRMAGPAFDYGDGGAGDERAMTANSAAFDDYWLVPRFMRDVSGADTAAEVLGAKLRAPILIAPMGFQVLCDPRGEAAMAEAAARTGLGFCLSTFASLSHPEVFDPQALPAVDVQQLYLMRHPEITDMVIERARAAGAEALMLTVDVPQIGDRGRDTDNTFSPFRAAPMWLTADREIRKRIVAATGVPGDTPDDALIAQCFPTPTVTADDVARLVETAGMPVLVKGVLHPDDAQRVIDAGAAGIVVSNHGGRQLDRVIPAVHALGPVVDRAAGRVPVWFDSGIRRGSHIAVALALGADAVLVGRPALWGLGAAGADGATEALAALTEDLRRHLVLCGYESVAALRADGRSSLREASARTGL